MVGWIPITSSFPDEFWLDGSPFGISGTVFYGPDPLPAIQPTVSKNLTLKEQRNKSIDSPASGLVSFFLPPALEPSGKGHCPH